MRRKCKKDGVDVWSEGFKINKKLDKRHKKVKYIFFNDSVVRCCWLIL
jgi:hypothetical protein